MDPLTHALLGATTSYALFAKKLGKKAALIGAVAALAPDADHFVSSKENVLLYVEFHRSFTHSFFFSIIGSFISALPWILQKKYRPEWRFLWLCALPAYLSHCLLDASTTYGTQLMWPFLRTRYGWDLIAVIDPIFTVALAIGLLIGLKRNSRSFVTAALIFCGSYLALGGVQKMRALNFQEELATKRGHAIKRSEVMPTLGNLLVWRSLYLTDGNIHSDRIRMGMFSGASYREGSALPQITHEQLTPLERKGNESSRAVDRFAWFSDYWLARSPFDETALGDMRYSISTKAFDPIWGIRFVEREGKIKVEWISRQLDRKLEPQELWKEIIGKHPEYRSLKK